MTGGKDFSTSKGSIVALIVVGLIGATLGASFLAVHAAALAGLRAESWQWQFMVGLYGGLIWGAICFGAVCPVLWSRWGRLGAAVAASGLVAWVLSFGVSFLTHLAWVGFNPSLS